MISIYSDGSSGAKGGKPGGWGWVIVRDDQPLAAGYGGSPSTTNNIMELTGAIEGMRAAQVLKERGVILQDEVVELVSDSQYTLGICSGKWNPTKNLEHAALGALLASNTLTRDAEGVPRTRWVRGHLLTADGKMPHPWNHRCDSLANKGKRENTRPSLLAKADKKKRRVKKIKSE